MGRIASLIIATYIAVVVYTNAFFIKALTVGEGSDQLFWNHLAIFLIILLPVYFVINRYISPPFIRNSLNPLRTLVLGVAFLGLTLSILYHVIPLEPIYDLPASVDRYFASDTFYTIWLLLPLAALFI